MIKLYKEYDKKIKELIEITNNYEAEELEKEVKEKTDYVKYSNHSYNLSPINPSLVLGKTMRNDIVVKKLRDSIKNEDYNKYYFSNEGKILKIEEHMCDEIIIYYSIYRENEVIFLPFRINRYEKNKIERYYWNCYIYDIKYENNKLKEILYATTEPKLKVEEYMYVSDRSIICNYDLYQPFIRYTSKDAEVGTLNSPVDRTKFEIELNEKGKPEKTIEYCYMNGEYKLVKVYDESKKKKLVKIDSNIVKEVIKEWIKKIDEEKSIGKEIKALYFGIGEIDYSLRLTGAIEYDKEDEDWACDEDYIPKNEECREIEYPEGIDPEKVLRIIKKALKEIISEFKEIELFKGRHVAVGFDDGELYIIK